MQFYSIDTGLKKGYRISTILFNLVVEKVVMNWTGFVFTTSKQLAAFAGDADLPGRGILAVDVEESLQTTAREVGLQVYEDKTKYLTLDRQHVSKIGQNITVLYLFFVWFLTSKWYSR